LANAEITKGFGAVTIFFDDGRVGNGTMEADAPATITLVTRANKTIRIDGNDIEGQTATRSAMPEMTTLLTLREIRDLVEYLYFLRKNDHPQCTSQARRMLLYGC
jgi:hypothetical protein